MQPVALADEVELEPGGLGSRDGRGDLPRRRGRQPRAAALRAFRERTGWDGAPVRLEIDKRIPVAAGMAGGSADAGAALRLAARAAGLARRRAAARDRRRARRRRARPGAPAALPGDRRRRAPDAAAPTRRRFGVLVSRSRHELSTADVYREADRLGLPRATRARASPAGCARLAPRPPTLPDELLANDLEPRRVSLCPELDAALADVLATPAPTTRSSAARARP